ncbi:MAG: hypothetical protein GX810_03660 [Clostridiales bacterium]|nr:hypothetical protein [Clostridiales bacterium]
MTSRFWVVVSALITAFACALSLGGRVFYLIAFVLALMLVYALLSVLLARALCVVTQQVDTPQAERGQQANLVVTIKNNSLLPVASWALAVQVPRGNLTAFVDAGFGRERTATFPMDLPHVGVAQPRVTALYARDLFGLLRIG